MLLMQAANRDPERFGCPAEFQIDRANVPRARCLRARNPLVSGGPVGSSGCEGYPRAALSRFAEFRISDAHHGLPEDRHYEYTPSWILRGLTALHLELTPAS